MTARHVKRRSRGVSGAPSDQARRAAEVQHDRFAVALEIPPFAYVGTTVASSGMNSPRSS